MKNVVIALALFALSACASTFSKLPALTPATRTPYVLGPADTLQISVYGETDLSGTYRVSDTGLIAVPLIGTLQAEGLTLDQLQRQLTEKLNANAVRSPNVTISISAYRPFFILGEVKTPGSYPYVPNMTVLTAVAIAGGFSYRAAENQVSITRQRDAGSIEARATRDARVLPGDVVYIFERHL